MGLGEVGGNGAQQLPGRHALGLAADIPERDVDRAHDPSRSRRGLQKRRPAWSVTGEARKRPSAVVSWTALDVCVHNGRKRPAVASRRATVDVDVHNGCKHPPRLQTRSRWTFADRASPTAAQVCCPAPRNSDHDRAGMCRSARRRPISPPGRVLRGGRSSPSRHRDAPRRPVVERVNADQHLAEPAIHRVGPGDSMQARATQAVRSVSPIPVIPSSVCTSATMSS